MSGYARVRIIKVRIIEEALGLESLFVDMYVCKTSLHGAGIELHLHNIGLYS